MIQRISTITPLPDYMLSVLFDDGRRVLYDVKDDIKHLPGFRTCIHKRLSKVWEWEIMTIVSAEDTVIS